MWKDDEARRASTTSATTRSAARSRSRRSSRARAALRRTGGRERAILVGFGGHGRGRRAEAEASLEELRELARTAGVEVLDATLQLRRDPDPRYLIGKGKLEDLVLRSMQLMATIIVFDAELSPSQARHIAEATSLKILDRTQLILDIFAQRAQTRGRQAPGRARAAQVPATAARRRATTRSRGSPAASAGAAPARRSSRSTAAACATGSPRSSGASRRSARTAQLRRKQRNERGLPVLSIVGYTNAGKCTLLNALTDSDGARRGQALRDARPDEPRGCASRASAR